MSNTKIYNSWRSMKKRCNNVNRKGYKYYGGRGILYDPSWEYFQEFLNDMRESYKEGLQLDRIDNNGNYNKDNCRWVTSKQNSNNKNNNHLLTNEGKTHTISEWSELVDIPLNTLYSRVRKNKWTDKEILTNRFLR